jgi:hypothetical protein
MSLRRGEHALTYLHRRLTRASAPGARAERCLGGEC